MRKINYLIIGIACLFLSTHVLMASSIIDGGGDGGVISVPIIVSEGDGSDGNVPKNRAPLFVPIEAAYVYASSSVMVEFLVNLGATVVTIENITAGEQCEIFINADIGVLYLPISGNTGSWQMYFRSVSGRTYVGEFTL